MDSLLNLCHKCFDFISSEKELSFQTVSICIPMKMSKAGVEQTVFNPDIPTIAVVAENLRPPLDEGIKKTSFNLITSIIKKGIKVSVFTRYENFLLANTLPIPGNKFLVGRSFIGDLKAQSPKVILYIPASSATIGAFIRSAMLKIQSHGKPVTLLALQYRKLPPFIPFLFPRRYVDLVFTQSQASAEILRSFGFKTIMIPAGIDHSIYQPVSKQKKGHLRLKYGFPESDLIVLHVGHCNRDRNVDVLAQLVRLGFRVIFVASTTTPIDSTLHAELIQSGVTVITSFIDNIQHFYQMADCYLFPVFRFSSAIDVPLSVLEAMACNLPVVTTRFGALGNMFAPTNGFNFINTEEEIYQMVKKSIEDRECKTHDMVSSYSWDNVSSIVLENLWEFAGS